MSANAAVLTIVEEWYERLVARARAVEDIENGSLVYVLDFTGDEITLLWSGLIISQEQGAAARYVTVLGDGDEVNRTDSALGLGFHSPGSPHSRQLTLRRLVGVPVTQDTRRPAAKKRRSVTLSTLTA